MYAHMGNDFQLKKNVANNATSFCFVSHFGFQLCDL